ncbi:phosphotransferase family protein [Streptomyces mutabilis]|uniref:phosphotransferase family protein n=1 Tax=Streptomyces TaxID=1883 RepID=UPI0015C6CC1E|nr:MULTISPECIES: aminoglycoside 3'-phosphotransferase/choline kinase family protein [unclassified Streptomyces]MDN3247097.1 aminoglycoside 3'-phosphotransferase/choline kinase family protein [Streptomyces sp. ZSW22]MDN3256466.1 aminoglycoside 3'-phosphotransferase/choline kinase family protein [Streptomyces sp. MA25(2023)]
MLPLVETDEEWDAIVPDETVMRPGAEDLCARLGLAGAPLTRFPDGSQPVYAVGEEHVLKLFPAAAAQDGVAEGRVLSYIDGRLPVPTPRVRDFGAYENGWQYVLMSRLRGENLARSWGNVSRADRERLVADTGEALAVLHSLDPDPLGDVLGPGDWGAFLDRQADGAVEQQRGHGLSPAWLEQIPDFLAATPLRRTPPRSLLHTEVMQQHFLVDPDGWRLTGLFDFEPAMIGDRAYDFVGVGLFVTRGDPDLLARLTKSYGRTFEPAELLAYTLLHVYSNLPWYMRELGAPAEGTLSSLAQAWFGTV